MISDADFIAPNQHRDNAIPSFYPKKKKNNFKSEAAGFPVYDSKEYVKILIPGDKLLQLDREVTEADKSRWPAQYQKFKAGLEYVPDGTLLEMWPAVDIDQVAHLKHFNVHTVESLSQISDSAVQAIGMGARDLQTKAKLWLAQAKDGSAMAKVIAERNEMAKKLEAMQDQINMLVKAPPAAAETPAPAPVPAAAPAISAEQIAAIVAQQVAAAMATVTPAAPAKAKPGPKPKAKPAPTDTPEV